MNQCPQCGVETRPNTKFCTRCGARLPADASVAPVYEVDRVDGEQGADQSEAAGSFVPYSADTEQAGKPTWPASWPKPEAVEPEARTGNGSEPSTDAEATKIESGAAADATEEPETGDASQEISSDRVEVVDENFAEVLDKKEEAVEEPVAAETSVVEVMEIGADRPREQDDDSDDPFEEWEEELIEDEAELVATESNQDQAADQERAELQDRAGDTEADQTSLEPEAVAVPADIQDQAEDSEADRTDQVTEAAEEPAQVAAGVATVQGVSSMGRLVALLDEARTLVAQQGSESEDRALAEDVAADLDALCKRSTEQGGAADILRETLAKAQSSPRDLDSMLGLMARVEDLNDLQRRHDELITGIQRAIARLRRPPDPQEETTG